MQKRFQSFTVLIAKLARYIHKIKAHEMARYDLKSTHVSCIYYLYVYESLTAKQLCDICDEDKAAISRSIDFLEENGYLSCDTVGKRYKSPFVLTEKGKEVGRSLYEKIDSILSEVENGVSEGDREILYKSLERISNNLQKIIVVEEIKE